MSGKGSAARPFSVKADVFAENYCATFGHKWRGERCVNCGTKNGPSGQSDNEELSNGE